MPLTSDLQCSDQGKAQVLTAVGLMLILVVLLLAAYAYFPHLCTRRPCCFSADRYLGKPAAPVFRQNAATIKVDSDCKFALREEDTA